MKKTAGLAYLAPTDLLLLTNAVCAQSIEAARTAFAEGLYVEAAELAEALGTSEGHALAAESLTIYGYHIAPEEEQPPLFERAMLAAEEAIRLDPANPQAHFQSAHAIGRDAQIVNAMGRIVAGMTYRASRRDALEYFEKALELATDNISVFVEYANGLLLLNRNRYREQARDLLTRGVEISPRDAYNRIIHDIAVERLAELSDD